MKIEIIKTNERLNQMIKKHSNWKTFLIKRYHKFVSAYIDSRYSIEEVAMKFHYTTNDMKMIFERIEKAFISYENEQSRLKKEQEEREKKERLEKLLKEQKEQERINKILDGLSEKTKKEIKKIIEEVKGKDIKEIFPERLCEYIEEILKTDDLDESVKRMNIRKSYFISRLIGRNKPRKPCEKGAMYYIETFNKNQKKPQV